MATYGTTAKEARPLVNFQLEEEVEEQQPLKKKRSSGGVQHPLPGDDTWHESKWRGAASTRQLRRPLWDPALYAVDDYVDDFVRARFSYLKESGLEYPKEWFSKRIGKWPWNELSIYLLLGVSILMDGVRPITLVWAKGGNASYPFMFSVWVVVVKVFVVVFSLIMYWLALRRGEVSDELSWAVKAKLSAYFLVPVVCFVASDVMNFVLFEHHISPTLFACVKQSRIVVTAILFRFVLQRNVTAIQWIAIMQLCLASVLFVSEDINTEAGGGEPTEMLGVYYLLFKCFLDSMAVVWMDKYFKKLDDSGFPYVEQQVVFAILSLVSGVLYVLYNNSDELFSGRALFDGWNEGAWVSVVLTAVYGMLVSLLLKYLDSMVKQFQALASVVVTTLCDQFIFGKHMNLSSWVAIVIILLSVFLYKVGTAPGKIHTE